MTTLVDIGTLIAALSAAGAIILGYVQYRRQVNVQVFLEYTARYEKIMQAFTDITEGRRSFEEPLPKRSHQLTIAVLTYLNLCSEEFYLWKEGLLSKKVWRIWEAELRRTLRSPLVQREWPDLKGEFQSYPAFSEYLETHQRN
jgi:hypothetical protein